RPDEDDAALRRFAAADRRFAAAPGHPGPAARRRRPRRPASRRRRTRTAARRRRHGRRLTPASPPSTPAGNMGPYTWARNTSPPGAGGRGDGWPRRPPPPRPLGTWALIPGRGTRRRRVR